MDTTITTLEMCAGYGGLGLGLKNIFGERLRTIAYCELEGFAQANLISKMEKGLLDAVPIWNDLKTFPYESFHGLVDILIAGYPCQPFSAAGKRAGKEDPRHLWPWIADGIRLLQPTMCFFENVEGHISLGLSSVISDLEELGYKVSWGIFSAREVGAPHQRKRVFILAHRKDERLKLWSPERWGIKDWGKRAEIWDQSIGQSGVSCWPSRPGEPQHEWEPPRVVADSRCGKRNGRQNCERTIGAAQSKFGEASAMGNATSQRPYRGTQDGLGQQPEVFRTGHEAMGNAEELFSNGSHNHSRVSERPEEISQSGDSSWKAMGNADHGRLTPSIESRSSAEADRGGQGDIEQTESRQTQPPLGRDPHGAAGGLGYAELQVAYDNRTDELRLLGNGVVPATAERAFLTLWEELNK